MKYKMSIWSKSTNLPNGEEGKIYNLAYKTAIGILKLVPDGSTIAQTQKAQIFQNIGPETCAEWKINSDKGSIYLRFCYCDENISAGRCMSLKVYFNDSNITNELHKAMNEIGFKTFTSHTL